MKQPKTKNMIFGVIFIIVSALCMVSCTDRPSDVLSTSTAESLVETATTVVNMTTAVI